MDDKNGVGPGPQGLFADQYRLLERVDEGGMGELYLAEEAEPIQRRVNIRILKSAVSARPCFEQQMRPLTFLDHPHLAKVFAVGQVGNLPHEGMP